ncbi:PilZ domain-containing protein, partial [Nitrospirota bacterium]
MILTGGDGRGIIVFEIMSIKNNRQDERYSFRYDVIINDQVYTQGVDISLGGMNVKTDTPSPSGETINLYVPQFEMSLKA